MNRFRSRYIELLNEKFELQSEMKQAFKKHKQGKFMHYYHRLKLIQFKLEWCDIMATKYGKQEWVQNNCKKEVA